jgi:Uma2 family endonuclease
VSSAANSRYDRSMTRRPATYEDLLAVPEHLVAEILAGELFTFPRPAPRHASATSVLGSDLNGPYQRGRGGPGGWWILDEPELHLGADVVVPDLGGWKRDRMPALPRTAFFETPPDWVGEVLSRSTALHDRLRKLPVYARAGVRWLWLVDPLVRSLEVFRLHEGAWLLDRVVGADDEVAIPPFEAVTVRLSDLWDAGASGETEGA